MWSFFYLTTGVTMESEFLDPSDKDKPLSLKTGYMFTCFLYLEKAYTNLRKVMEIMSEYKPWFDTDNNNPVMPRTKQEQLDIEKNIKKSR